MTLTNPVLWSLENPHLYALVTETKVGGTVVDRFVTRFGVRSIRFDPANGFFLNDKPVKLKDSCNHQDHAGVRAAIPDALRVWRAGAAEVDGLQRLSRLAQSADARTPGRLRPPGHPGDRRETRRMSSDPTAMAELERLVRRDRNHPSVILWSIGNEEPQQGTARGAKVAATMQAASQSPRSDAPGHGGDGQPGFGEGISAVIDVQRLQLSPREDGRLPRPLPDRADHRHRERQRGDHARRIRPRRGQELRARLRYRPSLVGDDRRDVGGATRPSALDGGRLHLDRLRLSRRGRRRSNRWPSIELAFRGVRHPCGFPKDSYYYYRAWLAVEAAAAPLAALELGRPRGGQPIARSGRSNCDEVEALPEHGKSQGARDVKPNRHVEMVRALCARRDPRRRTASYQGTARSSTAPAPRPRRSARPPPCAWPAGNRSEKLKADGQDVVAVLKVEVLGLAVASSPAPTRLVRFDLSGPADVISESAALPIPIQPWSPTSPSDPAWRKAQPPRRSCSRRRSSRTRRDQPGGRAPGNGRRSDRRRPEKRYSLDLDLLPDRSSPDAPRARRR
ncbi:glycoside hydrolase family 2 TIM barrel-domain containing protein [Caulobacter segnis]